MEEVAKVTQLLQQQVAELHAELLRAQAAAKQATPRTNPSLCQKAGKVSDFDSRQDNWADWALRLMCHVGGNYSGAEDVMAWAAAQNDEIRKDTSSTTTTKMHMT